MITKSELEHIKGALKTALKTALIRRIGMRNGGAETMAVPQRGDTVEAIKRRAAEKKAAEEKKKAEARARAAYRRKQRKFEENGLLEGFVQINWSLMAARDELKRRGFSLELMHKLKGDVVARISPWNKLHHADYVEYFIYQYYLSCSEVQIATLPADQQEPARKEWAKVLRPFKRREPWL